MTPLPSTIQEAATALASGAVTSRALVETCLARIAASAGTGGDAYLHVHADRALRQADTIDQQRRAGREPRNLAGIPISVKDLFDVAGETTAAGSRVLRDAPPAAATAPAIARLLAAGLIVVGRTNMTEFAFSGLGLNPHYGTPLSSFGRAERRIAGGSSSGAAVSVADGMALGAIGTDTGGSCRIPAALCGVTGFKPTARRVPLAGVLPLAPSLDSVGPIAPTAACCAALDALLAGQPDRKLPMQQLRHIRLFWPDNVAADDLDASTENAIDAALGRLDRAGVTIVHRPLLSLEAANAAYTRGSLAAAEAFAWHKDLLGRAASLYDPRIAARIAGGAEMTRQDYDWLLQERARIARQFAAEMQGFHALALPTVPIAPPLVSDLVTDAEYRRLNFLLLRNPSMINFFDGCAISLPCHRPGQPPAGFMLAAPTLHDDALLSLAAALEPVLRPELASPILNA